MEELSKMDQINNLAFDIMHATNQGEPFDRAADIYRLSLQPNLNENQKVVLDWLKNNAEWGTPTGLIYELTKRNSMAAEYIITAHDQLNKLEQFQVLAAFAEWGGNEK